MTNQIVTVNVTQISAPAPSTLQETGAFISQGGTTGAANTTTLVTNLADLSAILRPALALTSLSYDTMVVTATASANLPYENGDQFTVVIAGATPSGYNGTFLATVTGAQTFTYALASDPGAETIPGTWQSYSSTELLRMGTTFFAQGSGVAVYVLELGPGTAADGVTALSSFISAQVRQMFYSYLVPIAWADESTFVTFVGTFTSNTSKTYFFVTMDSGNYSDFADKKSVIGLIPSPDAAATEFQHAADFYASLRYHPSAAARVTPFAFTYLFGVTAYPLFGNGASFTSFKAAGVNWVGTGAEGGITNTILFWGTTMDKRDFTYWYSVDWAQINLDLNTANAVINGSNTPSNPLYYDQQGINRLQAVAAGTMSSGVTFGLVFGTIIQTSLTTQELAAALEAGTYTGYTIINAVPFNTYVAASPSDFSDGIYGGFTVIYTPNRGFTQIIYNLEVTDLVAA